jgi:hypothetical protein
MIRAEGRPEYWLPVIPAGCGRATLIRPPAGPRQGPRPTAHDEHVRRGHAHQWLRGGSRMRSELAVKQMSAHRCALSARAAETWLTLVLRRDARPGSDRGRPGVRSNEQNPRRPMGPDGGSVVRETTRQPEGYGNATPSPSRHSPPSVHIWCQPHRRGRSLHPLAPAEPEPAPGSGRGHRDLRHRPGRLPDQVRRARSARCRVRRRSARLRPGRPDPSGHRLRPYADHAQGQFRCPQPGGQRADDGGRRRQDRVHDGQGPARHPGQDDPAHPGRLRRALPGHRLREHRSPTCSRPSG